MKDKIKNCISFIVYNWFVKRHILWFGKSDDRKMKYRLALCLIFKNEGPFLKEWIDYHIALGVDHFYLYNNNSDDNYVEVLTPYIKKEIVTLIDFPENHAQAKAYRDCWYRFNGECNWLSFLDADEFICPKNETDINDWLKKWDKYPAIMVNHLMFGTGGKHEHDYSQNVTEQYTVCCPNMREMGKCFINTRYEISDAEWQTAFFHHHIYMLYPILGKVMRIPAANQYGKICRFMDFHGSLKKEDADIFVNHYWTKAWDVQKAKISKGDVFYSENPRKDYQYFFDVENNCTAVDFTIFRFIIRSKMQQGMIK